MVVVLPLGAIQGIKTMSATRGGRRRGTMFDELFDPEGLRIAYITIAARTYTNTDTQTHMHRILPLLSAYTCKNCQRTTCVRKNVGDYARSLAVGFASANSSRRITTEQIRARSSSYITGKTFASPGKKLRAIVMACWRYNIVNIAAMLTRGKIVGR